MLYGLYQLLGWLTFVIGVPVFLVYSLVTGRYGRALPQRFGFLAPGKLGFRENSTIWLHGASVGEVLLARILIRELAEILPEANFVLSTVTEQGMEVASRDAGERILCIYAPLDLKGIVNRSISRIKPLVYICLETELWPAVILEAKRSGVRLVLLNGRLSERSFRRYRLIKGLIGRIVSSFSMIAVIRQADANRYIGLGADPEKVRVLGNAKYDHDSNRPELEDEDFFRNWLNLQPGQPVFVAGSTHTGEEQMLLEVYTDLKRSSGLFELVWVVAPRHLQRLAEVENLLKQKKVSFERLSEIKKSHRKTDIILVDTIGDLAGLYSIATYVFCGGSLVERGGHNIMEAAVFGRPVFYGPSMKDFSDAVELLESVGAGFQVSGPEALKEQILFFKDHPEKYKEAGSRARKIATAQQGAARKQALLVKEVISH